MYDYTTASLLNQVKAEVVAPRGQPLITDAEILSIASKQLRGKIIPAYKKIRFDFMAYTKSYAIGSTNGFKLPARAIGSTVSNVMGLDGASNIVCQFMPLPGNQKGGNRRQSSRYSYYFQNNYIYLSEWPAPSSVVTLSIIYPIRPGDLVDSLTLAAQVTGQTATTLTISQNYGVSGTTTVDIISQDSPYSYLGIDNAASITGTTVTISAGVPSGITNGDWVCTAGTAPMPQIPYDLHHVLVLMTEAGVLRTLGDSKGFQMMMAEAAQAQADMFSLLQPRSDGASPKLTSDDPFINNWFTYPDSIA